MAEQLTYEQNLAINDRGGKLLVSAAAGSGKTKVLVDRLMSYLLDPAHPADLDMFLIITYTKAAAQELRGKIASKLTDKISEQPENRHLQQQMQRLHMTKISTVHSFCADILREYAYILDLPADFRVADEDECIDLQNYVLQQLLEDAYSQLETDSEIAAFIDTQGFGRDDRRIPEIILKIYHSAYCHLTPLEWLDWCSCDGSKNCTDASETIWGKYLMDDLSCYLDAQISALERCLKRAAVADGMEKSANLLQSTLDQLRTLRACKSWDEIYEHRSIDYGRLIFSKKITDHTLADQIKAVRDACKSGLGKKLSKFTDKSEQLLSDYSATTHAARGLVKLVKKFVAEYCKVKQAKRILDFADLEHKTLDLLIGKTRQGQTRVAREIAGRFREVMIDEYQDSNEVQDAIFRALTDTSNNCFMVGDVKQSIYRFRLADPNIFIDKYNRYIFAENAEAGQGRKILLSKNFRSCSGVLNAVNDVFTTCMSPEVGGLRYGKDEFLVEGIAHRPLPEAEVELYGIEVQTDTYAEEAAFVAQKIHELIDGTHMIRDGDGLRPITSGDIVILLRSPGSVGMEYEYALQQHGIRCATGAGDNLLDTEEVQSLLSLLQTINNPMQDIPLVATLFSRVFCFTANELAEIRSKCKVGSIYSALQVSELPKVKKFLETLEVLRRSAQMDSLSKLLMRIFAVTRMDSIFASLRDGDSRVENLQAFSQLVISFEKNSGNGLSGFLDHMSLVMQRGVPIQTVTCDPDAVTIMSIHKSKGLEFPVVFLCGLARQFNQESIRAQVLCDQELGLGLSCVNTLKRIQYPSLAKNAIAAKIKAEEISEELRVLYVALTRAKDRLIMTYSSQNIRNEIDELSKRIVLSDPLLLTSTADCHGRWILLTAILLHDKGWHINYVKAPDAISKAKSVLVENVELSNDIVQRISDSVSFVYPYMDATKTPSKQTATQLKGRDKDTEVAENAESLKIIRKWRQPTFAYTKVSAVDHGNAVHALMQYIHFEYCDSLDGIKSEVKRLVDQGYLSSEQAKSINVGQIKAFFDTDIGKSLRTTNDVIREFKFSVLMETDKINSSLPEDKILLQGVVDCALINDNGIYIIDFKTDKVTEENLDMTVEKYREQLHIYARALGRIYHKPVIAAKLYFFELDRFCDIF